MLEAIFLGILQGLTEFLPISSSAHLRIAGEFLPRAGDPGATFTAITQIGTELAVLIYFRKDISRIVRGFFASILRKNASEEVRRDGKLGWLIIVGSLPILVFGFLGQETIRTTFRSLWLIATMLIVFGLILGFLDWKRTKQTKARRSHVGSWNFLRFCSGTCLSPRRFAFGCNSRNGKTLGL